MQLYQDEFSLVEACKQGDRKAQFELYRRYSGKLYSVAMRYVSDSEKAADLLQDSFIKIFRSIEMFQHTGSFEGWMRRIVVNTALDELRKAGKMTLVYEYDERMPDHYYVDALSELTTQEILKEVQKLSPGYRTVFNLYVIEGYSHQEIGNMLNISEGTSKSQLARAKGILKNRIEKLQRLSS
jgi:RNA polymerase sigma-70 factor (ECF subfamily)